MALGVIRFYQRFISPLKGFHCAYRVHTGRCSCSVLGFRAIRRHGVFSGLAILAKRTHLCGVAFRRHACALPAQFASQRGFCDPGCDAPCDSGCDLPSLSSCDMAGKRGVIGACETACDVLSCADCGSCDWWSRKQKNYEAEKYVYIPPNSRIGREAKPSTEVKSNESDDPPS
jgi:putative component of membrane protein insertase Oxa1/YidC/SpoIIIJ protein YidD